MTGHGTLRRWGAIVVCGLLLGGCSAMGSLHFGDVTLGLQNGFAAMGSPVGLFLH